MSTKPIKALLLIEDNPGDARLLREMLHEQVEGQTQISHVTSMTAAEEHLSEHAVDIILLDLGLPDANGLEAIKRTHSAAPHTPLVVLTGMDDDTLGARALRAGAQDYLIKGQSEGRAMLRSLRYATERKLLEESLFAEKERAQVTLNSIADAVVCTDISGNITFLNPVAEKMTGWSLPESIGRPMTDVFRTLSVTSTEALETTAELAILQIRAVHLPPSCTLIRRDGLEIPIEDSIAAIHDRQGRPVGAVIVFRDVSVAREMAQQITHSAEHDALTGLPNRTLLNDRLAQAITAARRYSTNVAVLFLDLDGFKHINDSLGHPMGDRLLKSVSERLLTCVRSVDTVSRQGGDEFVVLLFDMPHPEGAATIAATILRAVAEPHRIDGHELHITASIGVSVFPDDGPDAESLIKNADTAMYQAKEGGRRNFRFFKPAMNAVAVERQSIEESLRRALDRQEFVLHYQPKIDIRTGEITGAEALIRWTHPEHGLISPGRFIPIAEDCGLILPIGRWVLQQACEQAQAWVDAGIRPTTMAVNVSAMEFRDENFLRNVFHILEQSRLNPRSLELELTESVLMKRAEATAFILQQLRIHGVQIAIDDFGTGYSSLSYLRRFPIDALKIDQSFVRQIGGAHDDTAIVTAVISMARSLKLRVVAEGVETQEELEFLQAHRCDEAQGYYFGRPMPAAQFSRLIETGIAPSTRAALRKMTKERANVRLVGEQGT